MNKIVIYCYCFFLLLFLFFSLLFVDPNFFYFEFIYSGIFSSYRNLVTIGYIIFLCVFIAFYVYLLFHKASFEKIYVKLIIFSTIILAIAYPAMLSFDICNYVATAKILFFYKENPYVIMPIEFSNDSILRFMHAPNKIALYGPFWVVITGIPFLLGFGNFL